MSSLEALDDTETTIADPELDAAAHMKLNLFKYLNKAGLVIGKHFDKYRYYKCPRPYNNDTEEFWQQHADISKCIIKILDSKTLKWRIFTPSNVHKHNNNNSSVNSDNNSDDGEDNSADDEDNISPVLILKYHVWDKVKYKTLRTILQESKIREDLLDLEKNIKIQHQHNQTSKDLITSLLDKYPIIEARLPDIIHQLDKMVSVDLLNSIFTIGFLGEVQHGKTTLLNAILGARMLPEGVSGACTAVPTTVKWANRKDFQLTVTYITESEWKDELYAFIDNYNPDYPASAVQMLAMRIKTVSEDIIPTRESKPKEFYANKFGTQESLCKHNPADFQKILTKLIVAPTPNSRIVPESLWSIVKSVDIEGPFAHLPPRARLIDLPGLNDANRARTERTITQLSLCTALIVVASADQPYVTTSQQELLQRVFSTSVEMHYMLFVITKVDSFDGNNTDSVASNLGVHVGDELQFYTIARGLYAVRLANKQITSAFKEWLNQYYPKHLSPIWFIVPTSARVALSGQFPHSFYIDLETTEIPVVRRFITKLSAQQAFFVYRYWDSHIAVWNTILSEDLTYIDVLIEKETKKIDEWNTYQQFIKKDETFHQRLELLLQKWEKIPPEIWQIATDRAHRGIFFNNDDMINILDHVEQCFAHFHGFIFKYLPQLNLRPFLTRIIYIELARLDYSIDPQALGEFVTNSVYPRILSWIAKLIDECTEYHHTQIQKFKTMLEKIALPQHITDEITTVLECVKAENDFNKAATPKKLTTSLFNIYVNEVLDEEAREKIRSNRAFCRDIPYSMKYEEFYANLHADFPPAANRKWKIRVAREDMLDATYKCFQREWELEKFCPLSVKIFEGNGVSEAVDEGGVTKELFTELAKALLSPDYLLFKQYTPGITYFNYNIGVQKKPDYLEELEFVGRLIGKAIYEQQTLDFSFSLALLTVLCERPLTYKHFEFVEPDYFSSLEDIKKNKNKDAFDFLTFEISKEEMGLRDAILLTSNGSEIAVTEHNCEDYVHLIARHKMYDLVKDAYKALLKGLHSIIPPKLLAMFNPTEMDILISGATTINISDLQKDATLDHHPHIISWLWQALSEMNNASRQTFVQFVTGATKIPSTGLNPPFSLKKLGDPSLLPTASTCFNTLYLPTYDNYDTLQVKLKLALEYGGVGFGMR